jgi:small subunit ribosomal protein S20
MANHKNAKKAIRQTARRTEVNCNRISRMRTFVKSAEKALGMHTAPAVSFDEAKVAVVAAESAMMRVAKTGIIHKNYVSRKVARLVARLKKLAS